MSGTFEKNKDGALQFVRNKRKADVVISIAIGIFFGIVFGAINYFLMKGSNPVDYGDPVQSFLLALNPAIGEEIVNRTVFYALCLSLAGGTLSGKGKKFTYLFMMMIPHILPHTAQALSSGKIIEWLVSVVLYVLIFGLIFTILQKKRDILSAMISHGVVDFIRFCIFGLPI